MAFTMEIVGRERKEFFIRGLLPGRKVIVSKMAIRAITTPFKRPKIPPAIWSDISSRNLLNPSSIAQIRIRVRK